LSASGCRAPRSFYRLNVPATAATVGAQLRKRPERRRRAGQLKVLARAAGESAGAIGASRQGSRHTKIKWRQGAHRQFRTFAEGGRFARKLAVATACRPKPVAPGLFVQGLMRVWISRWHWIGAEKTAGLKVPRQATGDLSALQNLKKEMRSRAALAFSGCAAAVSWKVRSTHCGSLCDGQGRSHRKARANWLRPLSLGSASRLDRPGDGSPWEGAALEDVSDTGAWVKLPPCRAGRPEQFRRVRERS